MFDRPCEVRPGSARSIEDAVYGPSVAGLGACFDAGGRFTGPGGACPLDPGIGLRVDGATEVTNPDAIRPDRRPSPTTWNAHAARRMTRRSPGTAGKTGPLGTVDCHDPAGYGSPVALATAPVVDTPLPDVEGRYQLCLLAGPGPVVDDHWQEARFATVLTAWVDKTPPLPAVTADVTAGPGGWTVEPRSVPPELVTFTWRVGPDATTDCADITKQRIWRHSPIRVAASDVPQRLCLTGYDPAGNPAPPFERVLDPRRCPPRPRPPCPRPARSPALRPAPGDLGRPHVTHPVRGPSRPARAASAHEARPPSRPAGRRARGADRRAAGPRERRRHRSWRPGVQVFPATNVWNKRVDQLPVRADSEKLKRTIGLVGPPAPRLQRRRRRRLRHPLPGGRLRRRPRPRSRSLGRTSRTRARTPSRTRRSSRTAATGTC